MKYKYEFELEDFEKGHCYTCPFSYDEDTPDGYDVCCVLMCRYDNCPLEEVGE